MSIEFDTVVLKKFVISSSRVVGRWSVRRAIPDILQGIVAPGHPFTLPSPSKSFHNPFDKSAPTLPHHFLPIHSLQPLHLQIYPCE
ncbi:hypothetical protein CROQUDRAFT_486617 [Cronartium quercuum f. sp. fusiforme G11]|uniref:Uncharacterized protein n=1 Tax=Cronartium quercuum f. sp. fusiforme G11 TaxID=708437 RepID=A0A9P6NJB7_9BASI|nr:hypothetical protein CROQUDRAFT_486617 [Cronartium quercuum f. sp. fusiforme G11]